MRTRQELNEILSLEERLACYDETRVLTFSKFMVLCLSWTEIISVEILFPSAYDFFIYSMNFQPEKERVRF